MRVTTSRAVRGDDLPRGAGGSRQDHGSQAQAGSFRPHTRVEGVCRVRNDFQLLTRDDKTEIEALRTVFSVVVCSLNIQKDYGVGVKRIWVGRWTYALFFGRHNNQPMDGAERKALVKKFRDRLTEDGELAAMFYHGGDRRRRARPERTQYRR